MGFFKQITVLLVIAGILVPKVSVLAANIMFDAHGNIRGGDAPGSSPTIDPLSPYSNDVPNTGAALGNQKPASAEERLRKERQDYEQKCEEEVGVGSLFKNLAKKSGTFTNTLAQGLQKQIPNTIEAFVSERLPVLMQERLKAVLPSLVSAGLRERLPGFVNNAISSMAAAGFDQAAVGAELPNIFDQGINNIVPQLIKEEIPSMTQELISEEMPGFVGERLSNGVPGLIENSNIPQKVAEIVAEAVKETQKSGEQQEETWKDSLGAWSTWTNTNIETDISRGEQELIEQGIISGMAEEAANGIRNSSELDRIAETMMPILTAWASSQIMPQLTGYLQGGFNELGGAGTFSMQALNVGGINLTGQGFDLSQGLSGEVFNPIITELQPSLGNWAYNLPSNIWSSFDPNAINPEDLLGADYGVINTATGEFNPASDVLANGYANTNPEAGALLGVSPGDNISTGASSLAADGASQVAANSSDIGKNALFSSEGLSQMGNGLKGTLADATGNIVGSYVQNVPVVGGLLAPLADQMVTQAMMGLLGVQPIGIWGVYDTGQQINTSAGLKGIADIEGKIHSNTSKSNQNEKELNDIQKKAKTVLVQMCTYEKMMADMEKKAREKEAIHDRDANKAGYLAERQIRNAYRDYFAKSYKVSPGLSGVDTGGQAPAKSVVADRKQDVADARKEAGITAIDNVENSGTPLAKETAQALSKQEGGSAIGSTLTADQIKTLEENPDSLDFETRYKQTMAYTNPFLSNSGTNSYANALAYKNAMEAKAEQEERDRFIANGGYRDTRECTDFIEKDGAKYCRYDASWKTITPGSTNKAMYEGLFTSLLNRLGNIDEMGEDFAIEPISNEIWSFKNPGATAEEAGTSKAPGSDACPGPGPCDQSGWQANQVSSQNTSKLSNNSMVDLFKNLLGNLSGEPEIEDKFSTPDPVSISSFNLSEDKTRISWEASDAVACYANNDWQGTTLDIKMGDGVDHASSTPISLSNLQPPLEFQIVCFGAMGGVKTATIRIDK